MEINVKELIAAADPPQSLVLPAVEPSLQIRDRSLAQTGSNTPGCYGPEMSSECAGPCGLSHTMAWQVTGGPGPRRPGAVY